ncbi:glycosyl-4,4'-diaponeurosporenoate acyltransferase [Atopococcus tabaci]|uniref:glycosyl-4,4'-diaponeurosporenoate acyltransferase CrtO family protein n=1 Tax=Atopococcus tabaci TaxID=269774 RepID=UPI00240968B8|nr:glycosyl-4,4'-diaponeurosporenoate acyltransferase [Atopococcus tabaci]
MQIIHLSPFWTVIVDVCAWAFFHLVISFGMLKVPDRYFAQKKDWFQPKEWEEDGKVWQKWLSIQDWKRHLPDGTLFLKSGYDKSRLNGSDLETLEQFITETKRAEVTHWLSMLPAGLFFLWNPPGAGWVMVAYAVLFNLPFILSQRYNRPRLERIHQRKKARTQLNKESRPV